MKPISKVYVEATNACNLDCRTCMRNVWEEPLGFMSLHNYERILDSIRSINPVPTIFFGGIGEPLAHPRIKEMVNLARKAGATVELITNGILLNEKAASWMVASGVERIWVSIDGARPESYMDIRLGDALPTVLKNLENLQKIIRKESGISLAKPRLGIAFVAMRRNLVDLPEVAKLGKKLGADLLSVSNVLPYTKELSEQILYRRSLYRGKSSLENNSPEISLPRFDLTDEITEVLNQLDSGAYKENLLDNISMMPLNTCPFLQNDSISIRWDGHVSPCLPLLHTHTGYLDDTMRSSQAYSLGRIEEKTLLEIWNDPEYINFRQKLEVFGFSPCVVCNSCEMAESNLEDCFGNVHPTCGGCLWAQGFIQCP